MLLPASLPVWLSEYLRLGCTRARVFQNVRAFVEIESLVQQVWRGTCDPAGVA